MLLKLINCKLWCKYKYQYTLLPNTINAELAEVSVCLLLIHVKNINPTYVIINGQSTVKPELRYCEVYDKGTYYSVTQKRYIWIIYSRILVFGVVEGKLQDVSLWNHKIWQHFNPLPTACFNIIVLKIELQLCVGSRNVASQRARVVPWQQSLGWSICWFFRAKINICFYQLS